MSNIFCYDIQDDNDSCYLWDEILNRLVFQFYKKIAFKVDPEKAHDISLSFLEFIYKSFLGKIFHKKFVKNGYLISDEVLNKKQVSSLRDELTKEFSLNTNNKVQKKLIDFKNTKLITQIINLYNHPSLQKIIDEIKTKYKSDVALLPPFEIHKNYHVNLKEFHGWHRDCGGELKYNYCTDILYSKDYFFSKIGFFLQKNEDYGGSIDIIRKSHKNFSKYKVILRKIKNIPLRIVMFIHKQLNKLYNLIHEG